MKILPDHVYPRGTRDIFVASLSNHSVSCGSVVPCVEISRLKANNIQGMSSTEANELVAASVSQKKIWISWKDKIEGNDRRKEERKPVQTKSRKSIIYFFPILVGLQHKPLTGADTLDSVKIVHSLNRCRKFRKRNRLLVTFDVFFTVLWTFWHLIL